MSSISTGFLLKKCDILHPYPLLAPLLGLPGPFLSCKVLKVLDI
jgi:hypothetical protein